ncbi:unnamed protein product [Durusdinium trenchii]|uniref:Ubiquitin-like domain-containing protein n=1 Tax=Durusdinium trenchii TaxID=1381693 RepID=A0ABP0R0F6_9DINO|eukprot:g11951.t1
MSKAAGKGPPLPPASGYGKGGSKTGTNTNSTKSHAVQLTVRRMTGEEMSVQTELDALIQSVRVSVGKNLGVSPHRIKLLAEDAQVLNNSSTVRQSGLEEGAILTSVVLPPVYGALGHAGISAPDEVISAKMELHDALSQAGKLTPIHTPS